MSILDEYFELSDYASTDKDSFDKLINLFSITAKVSPSNGSFIDNKDNIELFFKSFFDKNKILKHVWYTNIIDDRNIETKWAVAGIRKDNSIFSFTGTDKAIIDSDNKISYLEVRFDG